MNPAWVIFAFMPMWPQNTHFKMSSMKKVPTATDFQAGLRKSPCGSSLRAGRGGLDTCSTLGRPQAAPLPLRDLGPGRLEPK